MLKNYLKIAFRSIVKDKEYTIINVFGLTIGIVAALFIWQYVSFEKSYDRFHANAERIYRLPIQFFSQNKLEVTDAMNYAPTGPTLKEELPEVEEFVRFSPEYGRVVLAVDDKKFEEERIFFADSTLFNVFDFKLLDGNKSSCLTKPGSIVLTKSVAERYFGPMNTWLESLVGKGIRFNNERLLMITGILDDVPKNSHIKFNALLPFASFTENRPDPSNNWGWNDFYTYVQLKEGVSQAAFEAKIPDFIARHIEFDTEGTYDKFVVQPLTDIHLHSKLSYESEANGDGKTVAFLGIIGLAILFIAWINYINLATARAEDRSKEVGVRKVVGATRQTLITQFLAEAFVLNLLAILTALLLIFLVGPFINNYLGKTLTLSVASLPLGVWIFPIILFGGTFLSGLYPAFILSTFAPSQTLKGSTSRQKRGVWLRKGLVVFQYCVSVILIAGTISVYKQLRFMQNQDLGFTMDQTLVLHAPSVIDNDSVFQQRYNSFKNELRKYPIIESITSSSAIPGKSSLDLDLHGPFYLVGTPEEKGANFMTMRVEENFTEAYGMEMVAGRNFSPEMKTDKDGLIINETALHLLGLNEPGEAIGKRVQYWDKETAIVGVVKDYHHKSLRNAIEPMMLRNNKGSHIYYSLKFSSDNRATTDQVIRDVRSCWERVYSNNPFNFFFLDDHYNEQYAADGQLAKISGLFSILTIFIACLGLFGLASYTVTVRAKEIGIRKVLGASMSSLVLLFTQDYTRLLLVAFVIGIPLSYYLCHQWLENFAFAFELTASIFLLPCVLVLSIALIAVSSQSLRAARSNPVEVLRKD